MDELARVRAQLAEVVEEYTECEASIASLRVETTALRTALQESGSLAHGVVCDLSRYLLDLGTSVPSLKNSRVSATAANTLGSTGASLERRRRTMWQV